MGWEELGWDGRLKIRWLHRRLGLTTSAVVVAAGVAAVRAWPHAWQWLIALGLVIAAGAPITISAVSSAQQRRADAARVTRQALQGTTGPGGDILPLVRDSVDLETRVHRAVLPLSYLHRDVEATVRDSLKSGLPVLLVGPSMVGKTKMATTLIKDLFPARRIIIPASREALASLDAADLTLREGVIFLDDINRLIGTDGITDDTIRRLAKASNVIVGTIRASEYDRHQPTDKLRSPEWDTLSMFERIFITRDLSATERHRLDDIIHDEVARKRIFQIGLGEYAGAAERITEALRLGPSVSPVGYALVLGAASWQLAGMSGPVPSELLPSLAVPYLDIRKLADLSDENAYRAALEWAMREINPMVSLLQREAVDAFTVFDYALDLLFDEIKRIPNTSWSIIIEKADSRDLAIIGYTAHVIYSQSEIAKSAWRKAADSGEPKVAPVAAVDLGILLTEQGDIDGARAAFQLALDSQDDEQAPRAARGLGVLLTRQGDVAGARAAFQLALDSEDDEQAPRAARGLGILLGRLGDVKGARAAFQKAINSKDKDQAAKAALNLGNLLSGREEGAMTVGTFSFRAGFEEIGEERFRGTSILRGRFSRWKPVSPTSPASQNTTNQSVRLAFRPAPNLEDSWLKLNDDDGFWKELRSDKPTGTRVAERPFGGPKPIAEALGAYQRAKSIPVTPKRDRGQRSIWEFCWWS